MNPRTRSHGGRVKSDTCNDQARRSAVSERLAIIKNVPGDVRPKFGQNIIYLILKEHFFLLTDGL